jgi:hypothetical protein
MESQSGCQGRLSPIAVVAEADPERGRERPRTVEGTVHLGVDVHVDFTFMVQDFNDFGTRIRFLKNKKSIQKMRCRRHHSTYEVCASHLARFSKISKVNKVYVCRT